MCARPHLPYVGGEVGEKVSKGAVVGADDELHEDTPHYTPQPSGLETITKLSLLETITQPSELETTLPIPLNQKLHITCLLI